MSRAYRIKVSESLNRVIRASDHVSTQLELLEILPQETMAALLEKELETLGFEREGDVLVREQNGVTVEVDPKTGTVTARIEADQQMQLEREGEASVYDDFGSAARDQIQQAKRDQLKNEMEKEVDAEQKKLQQEITDRLEGELIDLRGELDQAVNRVTAEALKQKAAQIGQIKEMTEDQESGSRSLHSLCWETSSGLSIDQCHPPSRR
ncbi:MAG: hypothetical protein KDA84_08475 [Planctomycetaceae bacterium]|nr:hypothetical protein [Planctomycetaceae bacterium]